MRANGSRPAQQKGQRVKTGPVWGADRENSDYSRLIHTKSIRPVVGHFLEYVFFTRGIRGRGGKRSQTKKVEVVYFGTHNIQNGRNGDLGLAWNRMYQANVDLGLLQGTKSFGGLYAQESAGFCIVVYGGLSRHRRGMTPFYKYLLFFVVEYQQQHGPNIIRFQILPDKIRCHVVGCYLAPHNASTLEVVTAAIGHRPRDAEILVIRKFNIDLELPDGNEHKKEITAAMETEGIEYMMQNFLPRKIAQMLYGRTWSMICRGQEVRYHMDYILGTDRFLFQNVAVFYTRNNTNHYMVLQCLRGVTMKKHQH